MPRKKIDLAGKTFGRLTVISEFGRKNQHVTWLCKCDCGNTKVVTGGDLRSGDTRSCGCLYKESRQIPKKHGGCGTRLYSTWKNIINRCLNKNVTGYHNYGGRGITICDEWKNSFEAFRNWAVSHGYNDDLTIDRIDNAGNYEPENCRWITVYKQARNRRTNVMVGDMCLLDYCACNGLNYNTIKQRINGYGWTLERALKEPIKKQTKIKDVEIGMP